MKRFLARLIHYFKPNYFSNKSYARLSKWNITDVCDGKIYFD